MFLSLKNRILLPLFIVAVILLPRITNLNLFYARDELTIWSWSDNFTMAVWDGNPSETLTNSDYPGVPMFLAQTLFLTVKYSLPQLFQQPLVPRNEISKNHGLELLAERRLVAGLFVSLQLIAVIWMTYLLFGWQTAILSAIFIGLDPFSLSEARLLRLEMVSAAFVCLSVLAYFLYFRRRHIFWLILSGVMAGLSVSSKISAGLIVPYIWLLLLSDFLWIDEQTGDVTLKFKRMIKNGLIWAGAAIAIFGIIWPAMWVKPVEAVYYLLWRGIMQASQESVWHGVVFFWGQTIPNDPGYFFYPVVLSFRTTPLTWIGVIITLFLMIKSRLSKSENKANLEIILLSAYIILLIVELTFIISKVDRFLLIIFPALNILSAIGFVSVIQWVSLKLSGTIKYTYTPTILIIAILAIQLGYTIPAHPYYFTYWNSWLGGGKTAMTTLPVGSGEGVDIAIKYLNSQPGAAEKSLICGASRPWCARLFDGNTLRYATYHNGSWVNADYASLYISQLQRQLYPSEIVDFFTNREPLYQVELQDVTYMQVYEIPKIEHPSEPLNDLAGLGRLLGYTLSPTDSLGAGGTVEATIWWVNFGAGVNRLTLRLVDETGYEWQRVAVIPQPGYATIPAKRRAIVAGNATLTIPPGTPPGLYFLRLGILEQAREKKLLGEFKMPAESSRLALTTGQIFTKTDILAIPNRLNKPLSPNITLLGYTSPKQALTAKKMAWLKLYWQATIDYSPADYSVILRLLNNVGDEVSRWQKKPGYASRLQHGQIMQDVWALQVEPDIPTGLYSLEISLYNPSKPEPSTYKAAKIENIEVWPQPVSYDIPPMQAELQTSFGDNLTLLGYDLYFDIDRTAGTGYFSPILYWQSKANFEGVFNILLTLRAVDTNKIIKEWRVPLGTSEARTFWKKGEIISAIYKLKAGVITDKRYHLDITLENQANTNMETPYTVSIEDAQNKIVVRVK